MHKGVEMSKRQPTRRPPVRRPPRPKWVTAFSLPLPEVRAAFEQTAHLAELTREERLRLALDFVAADLAAFTDEQRAERLRVLFTIARPRRVDTDRGPISWEAREYLVDADLTALQELQTQLR